MTATRTTISTIGGGVGGGGRSSSGGGGRSSSSAGDICRRGGCIIPVRIDIVVICI